MGKDELPHWHDPPPLAGGPSGSIVLPTVAIACDTAGVGYADAAATLVPSVQLPDCPTALGAYDADCLASLSSRGGSPASMMATLIGDLDCSLASY